ncbi:ABC transporter ATP-binding protein [Devosia nitrariae]|uniref:Peptide ABC transporter substrate-binding protein n=1 Tax=Devosia nitrariae TaxID=2071872 RepID=A0ABQ5W8K6_9HYPH|nr:ABC transporter ATP-binding protein [Devosia nitrariae]GLQ56439.1 peptide ABC transporter substrate-binding protein [Devosia nitrariae]
MTAHIASLPADRASPALDTRIVLEVEGLSLSLRNADGLLPIVTDVSFAIRQGEAVALVGESGCGKSITASAIMGIAPDNAEIGGTITLNGQAISGLSPRARRKLCGRHMGFIFQEPMTALHPTLSIGRQMTDTLRHNLGLSHAEATSRAAQLLDRVGIPRARDILKGYVHELSGGMRQRVMIALAISCGPSLVIADEPTTALDVTIQAQVLDLLDDMRRELDLAMLFITHDLEVVGDFCDRAVVMYAGDVVERGLSADIVRSPAHPYARGLIDAVPDHDDGRTRLTPILGTVPPVGQWPPGCRFAPRCNRVDAQCRTRPALELHGSTEARCWHPLEPSA